MHRPAHGIKWSTKLLNNKEIDSPSSLTGLDCKRTTPMSSDKAAPLTHGSKIKDCKVVLDDVLSNGSTVKFDVLKSNPDKTHSVSSHKTVERN